jgi:hypothetical protein
LSISVGTVCKIQKLSLCVVLLSVATVIFIEGFFDDMDNRSQKVTDQDRRMVDGSQLTSDIGVDAEEIDEIAEASEEQAEEISGISETVSRLTE